MHSADNASGIKTFYSVDTLWHGTESRSFAQATNNYSTISAGETQIYSYKLNTTSVALCAFAINRPKPVS